MNGNHAGTLETGNVRATTAPVSRVADDDLEAAAEVAKVFDRLDRVNQRRVAAFVARRYGSDE